MKSNDAARDSTEEAAPEATQGHQQAVVCPACLQESQAPPTPLGRSRSATCHN